jgi:hypothetical protein
VSLQHLYAASAGSDVTRFPIVNGVLQDTSDRTYDIGDVYAVTPQGQIYASAGAGSQTVQVSVYDVTDGHLLRSFTVTRPPGVPPNFLITAIGVDRAGFIYTAIDGSYPPHDVGRVIEVFKPQASGTPKPVSTFTTGLVQGMAFDSEGELFIAQQGRTRQGATIRVITHPRTQPVVSRVLKGRPITGLQMGIVIDASDELYLGCSDKRGEYVLAYPASVTDPTKPDRIIRFSTPAGETGTTDDIAIQRNQLYVADGAILEFNKTVDGFQQPIAELGFTTVSRVWVGP